jgi:hypothetical protein
MKTITCTLLLLISLPLSAQSREDREAVERFRQIVEIEEKQEEEAARKKFLKENAPANDGSGYIILFLFACGVLLGIKDRL